MFDDFCLDLTSPFNSPAVLPCLYCKKKIGLSKTHWLVVSSKQWHQSWLFHAAVGIGPKILLLFLPIAGPLASAETVCHVMS